MLLQLTENSIGHTMCHHSHLSPLRYPLKCVTGQIVRVHVSSLANLNRILTEKYRCVVVSFPAHLSLPRDLMGVGTAVCVRGTTARTLGNQLILSKTLENQFSDSKNTCSDTMFGRHEHVFGVFDEVSNVRAVCGLTTCHFSLPMTETRWVRVDELQRQNAT